MLNLIIGRAGTGKTTLVQKDILRRMSAGEKELLLVVPEQYSHDAERQLCGFCGDEMSMHAEVLSFTRLCGRVFSELGYSSNFLDEGGQILLMHRAMEAVAPDLKAYGAVNNRIELLKSLLEAINEFKSCSISTQNLESAVPDTSDTLSAKLHDLALIKSAYESLLAISGGDMSDMLTKLAELITESRIGEEGHVYFDGFNDFTSQELRVIEELLKKNVDITVCLTYSADDDSDNEVFIIPRETAGQLHSMAKKHGIKTTYTHCGSDEHHLDSQMRFLEKHLFSSKPAIYPEKCDAVTVYHAATRYEQCEYAAEKIIKLINSGYRWRDIAVMARNWDEYSSICENVFEKHEITFFSSGKEDILDKAPIAQIDAALEIATSGWEYKAVFRYLKSGLSGISAQDCSELENYVLKWNIRGSLWLREWRLPPGGYGVQASADALTRLNALRLNIIEPILRLKEAIKNTSQTGQKLKALFAFLEETGLPIFLLDKAAALYERGDSRLSDEYIQLWDVIVKAMDQMYELCGETMISAIDFRKTFKLVMSGYDVGVIPVFLDAVALGGMAMSRRRNIKCLIILGATDENMPMLEKSGGALSESERIELVNLGLGIFAGIEERLSREMNMLYSVLTLPSQELVVAYSNDDGARPSFIIKRLMSIFGISELSKIHERETGKFSSKHSTDTQRILSIDAAKELYGLTLSLSPSRVDRYYQCPYQHFLQNGLKLRPRTPAAFDAPMAGLFMHFVLEKVLEKIKNTVGFKNADEEYCRALATRYIERFVEEDLFDFEGKNKRFIYLFRRLENDVMRILTDMLDELRLSDFQPFDFELDLSGLTKGSEPIGLLSSVNLRGIVDRIDGWKHGEKLYIRVIDYKTGRKSFSLSDVMLGRDMQMLIYLFALQQYGKDRYGSEIEPAGVLYFPARDVMLKTQRNISDEDIKRIRKRELRRDGIILNNQTVLDAMEHGEHKQYIPVKQSKDGEISGNSLVTPRQLEVLAKHVKHMLENAVIEILGGEIKCNPYYKNENDNACVYCDYHAICNYTEQDGATRRFAVNKKPAEIWKQLGVFEK